MQHFRFPRSVHAHLLTISLMAVSPMHLKAAENQSIDVDSTGHASAAVVDDRALVHTTQLLPFDDSGNIATADLEGQIDQLLTNLSSVLNDVGTSTSEIARLNIYVTSSDLVGRVRELLSRKLLREVHPAVTYVATPLPDQRALVGIDAIASIAASESAKVIRTSDPPLARLHGTPLASVLPRGRAVYISGMAERSDDLATASTGTMKQLHGVLKLLGLGPEHVVHVKAYMKPMTEVPVAREAIRKASPEGMSPSMTFVEWSNGLPIEIEMIAFLPGPAETDQTVQHRWQPEEKRSPVYCRFAVVDSPTRIYVSGLQSRTKLNAAGQVRDVFGQLEQTLGQAESDLLHLVKATYYVADDEVSQALNEVRPEFYDPQRPPAASKASIAGTGDAERTLTIDMIAVPAGK